MNFGKHRVTVRAGRFEFVKLNSGHTELRDIYHALLLLSWPGFFGVIILTYFGVNALFSVLYAIGGNCVDGMPPGSLSDAFFFSVETLATVGYGHMYPSSTYGHWVATLEIMTGMFGMALITGIIFVRFSRPVARITFSRHMVVGPFDKKPALMIRVANMRHHAMAEAEFRLMMIRTEDLAEGSMRRFYPLQLQFDRLIAFPTVLTIRHIIDENSPIYGQTKEDLKAGEVVFMSSVVCVDTAIPASVQSQYQYSYDDVHFNHRFVEIYTDLSENRFEVDYGKIHDVELISADSPITSSEHTRR